jgi:hypothetical protein
MNFTEFQCEAKSEDASGEEAAGIIRDMKAVPPNREMKEGIMDDMGKMLVDMSQMCDAMKVSLDDVATMALTGTTKESQ